MGQFLRDEQLKNLAIDEAALDRINSFLLAQAAAKNVGQADQAKIVFWHYVIRFDGKGYRLTNLVDVKTEFSQADVVERIWFTLDSGENIRSNSMLGTNVTVRLDAKDPNACWLTVSDDDKAWVDSTFAGVNGILNRQRSASRFVRTAWTALVIQLLGVIVGFLLSFWAAVSVAPRLSIEHAFTVSFIFALLIFSNTWGYLSTQLGRIVDSGFPNLRFQRKDKDALHWLAKAIVGGLAVAVTLLVLNTLFNAAANLLGRFLK